jgi:nitrite reductase (NADH) small subunit
VKHSAGPVEDFEPGTIQIVSLARRSIGIVNSGEKLYAVLNICPHEVAPVCEGRLSGTMMPCLPGEPAYGLHNRILRCPWHGYEFDLEDNGRAAFTTFKARVRLFPVTVEDGQVMVEIKERSGRRQGSAAGDVARGNAAPS